MALDGLPETAGKVTQADREHGLDADGEWVKAQSRSIRIAHMIGRCRLRLADTYLLLDHL